MKPGDRISVARDDESFTGSITEVEAVSIGGQSRDRLTVRRDDFDSLTYVVVGIEGVDITPEGVLPTPLADTDAFPHDPGEPDDLSDEPIRRPASLAPPMGPSSGGVPMVMPALGGNLPAPLVLPAPSEPVAPPVPERVMVQSTGKPSRYHTRPDCGKVPDGARTRVVSDEDIDFFELEQCSFCARRDRQIGWQEAIASVAPAQAEAIVAVLTDMGFKVTPEVVERESVEGSEP